MTKVNIPLLKQAILAHQANRRQATSHAKSRGEVSGGGRKPWRQKGTGRARAGSNRSPIWVGGGITFGPTKSRNYKQTLPKKMNKRAMIELTNHLQAEGLLTIIAKLSLKEAKTSAARELLSEHGLTGKRVVFVTEKIEPELVLATRNLPGIKVMTVTDLSLLDLTAGHILAESAVAERWGMNIATKAAAKKPAVPKSQKDN